MSDDNIIYCYTQLEQRLVDKIEKYETALRLITTVPKYDHIMSGDNPYWDSDVLLDGHDQCVEIAKRALEG